MSPARLPHRLAALPALVVGLLGLAAIAVAVPSEASAARTCRGADATPSKSHDRRAVRATLCLLNAERRRRGMRKLGLRRKLSVAARRHARDMVERSYFSHSSLSGASFVERIRRTGYLRGARRWSVGENLAWGSGARSSPAQIVGSWMRSDGHRANILTRGWRHVGVGIVAGAPAEVGSPAATYATEFGVKR